MTSKEIVKEAIEPYRENDLILASKLYREQLAGKIREDTYYKTLERLCTVGELSKIAKGTYYIPKKGKYGVVPPSEKQIVASFTDDAKGTIVGYRLYNSLNLTTQVAKQIRVMSSALEGFTKTIRNIVVQQVELNYSTEIKNMIHGLEVLQNFSDIQDINYSAFLSFANGFAENYSEEAFETVLKAKKYPKSTIAFMCEVLSYHGVKHSADRHLSSLSSYKHPKMEELYAAARIQ